MHTAGERKVLGVCTDCQAGSEWPSSGRRQACRIQEVRGLASLHQPEPPVDYYELLQVNEDADPGTIKAAYRRLVREYHPDISGDNRRMRLLNEAYQVLMDPARRAAYDRSRRERTTSTSAPPEDAESVVVTCEHCGTQNRIDLKKVRPGVVPVCSQCKADLPWPGRRSPEDVREEHPPEVGSSPAPESRQVPDKPIALTPPWRAVLLLAFTMNLYLFVWAYTVWATLRRTSRSAYSYSPLLNTLGLLVPVVNLWLLYDLFRRIESQRSQAQLPPSIHPLAMTAGVVLALLLGRISESAWLTILTLSLILYSSQAALNEALAARTDLRTSSDWTSLEIILLIAGTLLWVSFLSSGSDFVPSGLGVV